MSMDKRNTFRHWVAAALSAFYLAFPAASWSATLNISDIPLFLGGGIAPNIMMTLDDSGSMYWSYMPGGYSEPRNKRGLASNYNVLAYDPFQTYSPPLDSDGSSLSNASFTAAWDDGYANAVGDTTCTVNLSTTYRPTWHYGNHCDADRNVSPNWNEYWSTTAETAYYYVYYLNHPDGPQSVPADCSESETDDDCYIKITVTSSSGPNDADERQNFANWYSYYRKRAYVAKAGIGRAFAQQGINLRVGFAAINKGSTSIDGVNTHTIRRGVRAFSGSDRDDFFDLLYGWDIPEANTPLRRAADAVGQYFMRDDAQGPWSDTPGADGGSELSCRPAYHIIMSDGYWTEGGDYDADTPAAELNVDGTDGPTHTSVAGGTYTYDATSPFSDAHDETLADVAMYYWKNDLRDDLTNNVAPNSADPAFWQHLVTFSVGLGVSGSIDPDTAFAAIGDPDAPAITWPDPFDGDSQKIDDLLHAAVNGRGGFYSASNPTEFADALDDTLNAIADRTSSAASVVLNSNTLFSGSRLYQAIFRTSDWSGDLRAYSINQGDGTPSLLTGYSPADDIPAPNNRLIVSFNGTKGVPFRWSASPNANTLTAAQQTAIGSADILNYIRGVQSNEEPNGSLRARDSLLGDIINSTPVFVNPPSAPYFDNWGDGAPENAAPYSTFRINNATRSPFIAVGANDGMLHVFDATSGVELYAYVPSKVLGNLSDLTVPGYDHTYYVDGAPAVADAFFGSAWRTVLAGGLNAGGQGIYALDITTRPSVGADEATLGAAKVLWEFSDANDADLGFTFSRPNIVRLNNGVWAAIFGNGYNNTVADGAASTTGNAVLYIVNLQTGALIKKIDTKDGTAQDPLGESRPNGLSTVAPVDVDGDFIVDYVYGGDLFGNMWKFDLSSSNTTQWGIPYGNTSNPLPLFTARANDADATTAQPITVRPQVTRHPEGRAGRLVLFGTGKYFETGDNSGTGQDNQTFYAVWDRDENNLTAFNRSDLLEQQVTAEVTQNGVEYRVTSNNPLLWHLTGGDPDEGRYIGWYMDLYNKGGGDTNHGERAVSDPVVRGDRVIFTTLIPSDDPCEYGGTGWLMEVQWATGQRPLEPPFDVNNDGYFSTDDYVDPDGDGEAQATTTSGRKSNVGIIPTPAILSTGGSGGGGGGQLEYKYESGSTGQVEKIDENPGAGEFGRQSWRQLFK